MTEPVTAHTQRFVRSLWTLDRDLAYGRHYPAVAWTGSYCRDIGAIGAWYAASGDPGWAARRSRAVALLAEADRLAALAEIVGASALPGHERVVLLAGRLLRESVLQQSALSTNDAYCTPEKSAALIDAVLSTVDRCDELVAAGVSVSALEEVDFSPLVRAREEAAPDGVTAVQDQVELVRKRLEEVAL
jgi:V/A-type H+-transporting ATPase subunit A